MGLNTPKASTKRSHSISPRGVVTALIRSWVFEKPVIFSLHVNRGAPFSATSGQGMSKGSRIAAFICRYEQRPGNLIPGICETRIPRNDLVSIEDINLDSGA